MLDTNLKPQTWSRLRRKLFSVRLRPWRHASNRGIAALLCTTLMVCLLCRSKEREPEIVPSGGRNRPRLPWLRKRPARRAPLNVAAAVVGSSCTNVATGAELAVDHRGILCYLEQLEPEGCCGAAHLGRFNCDGCELQAEHGTCCLEFERCVSCCIGAAGTDAVATVELALTMEACVGRCRTGSKSLDAKVWNRFRSEWKYCNGGSVSEQGQGLVGGVDAVS